MALEKTRKIGIFFSYCVATLLCLVLYVCIVHNCNHTVFEIFQFCSHFHCFVIYSVLNQVPCLLCESILLDGRD